LPDKLNKALHIYEQSGKHCGTLVITDSSGHLSQQKLVWVHPPGLNEPPAFKDSISNTYLAGFVKSFYNEGTDAVNDAKSLESVWKLCLKKMSFNDMADTSNTTALGRLMGKPIALVRASLQLRLSGIPAQPQTQGHEITIETLRVPPGLNEIHFPVTIGDSSRPGDGLVCFYEDSSGFAERYVPLGSDSRRNKFIKVEVNASPKFLTMLIDPYAGVNLNCGILPVKYVELPRQHLLGIKNLLTNMLVAPVLGDPRKPDIPVSTEPGMIWELVTKNAEKWENGIELGSQKNKGIDIIQNQFAYEGYIVLKPEKKN
jgi:hypothetical protein